MGDNWQDDFEVDFSSERGVLDCYYASLHVQFLQAAWFLRIVPDVYFKFVDFNHRCQELRIEIPVELEKYVHFGIGIEIISPKHGTLHIFGPADFEVRLEQIGKYFLTKPSIRLEGTYFDEVIGIVSNIQKIFQDKYFGEVWEMNRYGYIQNRHIDLYDARKLESLSLIFEAWYIVLQENLKNTSVDVFHNFAFLSSGSNNELYGKLYLPGGEEIYETCVALFEGHVQILEHENSKTAEKLLSALLQATQNPNRP